MKNTSLLQGMTLQKQLRLMTGMTLIGMLAVILFAMFNLSQLRKEFATYQSRQAMDKSLVTIKVTALEVSRADLILLETQDRLNQADKQIQALQQQMLGMSDDAALREKMTALSEGAIINSGLLSPGG